VTGSRGLQPFGEKARPGLLGHQYRGANYSVIAGIHVLMFASDRLKLGSGYS